MQDCLLPSEGLEEVVTLLLIDVAGKISLFGTLRASARTILQRNIRHSLVGNQGAAHLGKYGHQDTNVLLGIVAEGVGRRLRPSDEGLVEAVIEDGLDDVRDNGSIHSSHFCSP